MFRELSLVLVLLTGLSCGFPSTRIVNGTDADEGEFPYVASLRSSSGSHSCGCSIINENWLLTAAHCVQYTSPSSVNVQYGVTVIDKAGPNVAKVTEIIVHEGYNPGNMYIHDIALLKLEKPLQFNEFVQPIHLPSFMHEIPGRTPSILVGWGYDKTGGSAQKHLQKADLVTFSDDECQDRHHGSPHLSNICAGVPEGGKGQCSGDSGGPLTVNGEQVGIVSWSVKPCAVAPYPGVYTKVSHYIEWIQKNAGKIFQN